MPNPSSASTSLAGFCIIGGCHETALGSRLSAVLQERGQALWFLPPLVIALGSYANALDWFVLARYFQDQRPVI